jgi:hypothetical protein
VQICPFRLPFRHLHLSQLLLLPIAGDEGVILVDPINEAFNVVVEPLTELYPFIGNVYKVVD